MVSLSPHGVWQWTRFGTLGGPNVSSHRAELRALLEALRRAVPPLRIHTDNQSVVDGVANGRVWCVSSKSADADLWRDVWHLLDSKRMFGEISVVKVRAHIGWEQLLARTIFPRDQFGNWLADAAAKTGASRAEAEAPAAACRAQVAKALAWLKWAARYVSKWIKDTSAGEGIVAQRETGAEDQGPVFDFGDAQLRHEAWEVGNRVVCRRCGVSRQLTQTQNAPLPSRCDGTAAGRAAAQTTGNINYIWTHFASTRAALIEKGGRLVSAPRPP